MRSLPDLLHSFQRNPYLIHVDCPDNQDTITAIIDAASDVGAGKVGSYSRVAMIVRGEETWMSGLDTHPTIGAPGEISVEPSVRISMQCSRRNLNKAVEAIATVHPYEEPVIEITPLVRREVVLAAIQKTVRLKAGHK